MFESFLFCLTQGWQRGEVPSGTNENKKTKQKNTELFSGGAAVHLTL